MMIFMTTSELSTLLDFIRYATSQFNKNQLYYGHGTDNAWDEATALIFHTLRLPHHLYNTVLNAKLTSPEKVLLLQLIEKRIKERIPVPYLTNEAWFANLSFYVDERVLIPRSPIAELIEQRFAPWVEEEQVNNILDLCTGSGCIAIACAKAFPYAAVDASDISNDALTVAKLNTLRHNVEDQVQLIQSDLFQHIPPNKKYDIIVSNPPYVSLHEMETLYAEYKHEPALGLSAGPKGLDAVMQILRDALTHLTDEGILVVEVGNSEEALIEDFPEVPFTWLEFERGADGVFLITAQELKEYHHLFMSYV